MPKATLEIKDEFIFRFSKMTVGSEESIREIPDFVRNHFIKNVPDRFQLKNEAYKERYTQSPKPIVNSDTDPLYLMEIELSFSGKKLGGISYSPTYSNDSKIEVKFLEAVGEDEQDFLLKFHVEGQLNWDYKSSEYNRHVSSVERHESTWKEAKISLRLNFRDNFMVKDSFIYDKYGSKLANQPWEEINGKPIGTPENEFNLGFILGITPNIFSYVNGSDPATAFEKNDKYFQKVSDKNIHMKCKYLSF